MVNVLLEHGSVLVAFNNAIFVRIKRFFTNHSFVLAICFLSVVSIASFVVFSLNGLALAYNDARSHLDIGRRVVEGLKPGVAQLGSVWLPLNHLLMVPTIWNDFMWHSGLSGALVSMVSCVVTGIYIYLTLQKLKVGITGRWVGIIIFIANLNVLYLQSTSMTELLLLATMTAGAYELLKWADSERAFDLLKAAFWIMLSTLVRYDGWFLFAVALGIILFLAYKKHGLRTAEGIVIYFSTLGAFGIFLWLLWNQLIFKDAFYFAFGPYSAKAQQTMLQEAGNLLTAGNLRLSLQFYLYAMVYNSGAFTTFLGLCGAFVLWFDKRVNRELRLTSSVLLAPFVFNVLALYLGHSVLFIQGMSGNTWFNIRYGMMMIPSIAIFIGILVDRLKDLRKEIVGLLCLVLIFSFSSFDSVTIDDARVGASQKNVSEVGNWLRQYASNRPGFVLISAASHDAIIFSSGLPMKRFIHEGTGAYWQQAAVNPTRWARWLVMRTHDLNDMTFKNVSKTGELSNYVLVGSYPFADIYELKEIYLSGLITEPVFGKQK